MAEIPERCESDCESFPPCKHCGHPGLNHDDEFGSCDALGITETLHEVCDCPGYEEVEEYESPLEAAKSRIRELEQAMQCYGQHKPRCEYYNPEGCTCGLSALHVTDKVDQK